MATLHSEWDELLKDAEGHSSIAGTHDDLLATLLAGADALQGCGMGSPGLSGRGAGMLTQADELQLMSILGSGEMSSVMTSSPAHSACSPQSVGSAAYSCSSGGSPLNSNDSAASGHDADISAASSPDSNLSLLLNPGSNAAPSHCMQSYLATGSATATGAPAATSLEIDDKLLAWCSSSEPVSLESLLAGSDLPSSGPGLITEAQLTSLRASFELPCPATTKTPAATGLLAKSGVDLSMLSMSATVASSSTLAVSPGSASSQSPPQDVSIDLSFSADPAFSSTFSEQLANASSGQDSDASGSRDRLVLTTEEKRLLTQENVELPQYLPLTKQEEKSLKRVQRKIKNKISALDSRKRKKEYVDGLETRVESTTGENRRLQKRVRLLEDTNKNLMGHLKKLQDVVMSIYPTARPLHTGVAVFVVSFALFLVPGYFPDTAPTAMEVSMAYAGGKVRTRVLLAPEVSNGYMSAETMELPQSIPLETGQDAAQKSAEVRHGSDADAADAADDADAVLSEEQRTADSAFGNAGHTRGDSMPEQTAPGGMGIEELLDARSRDHPWDELGHQLRDEI